MKRLFAAVLLLSGCRTPSQVVTPADEALCLTVADLRAQGHPVHPALEQTWGRTALADIYYHAQPPAINGVSLSLNQTLKAGSLVLYETLDDNNTAKNAASHLASARGTMKGFLQEDKLSEVAMSKQPRYGEASSLTIVKQGKTGVGNCFVARQGGRVFTLMLVGVCFTDPKKWEGFAGPKVRAWLSRSADLSPNTWK